MLFPMYTVPSEALLQMTAVEPHEVLKASWLIGPWVFYPNRGFTAILR